MKIAVPCLYAVYGRYTDELRAIPYHLDCLKPVERRILYALHDIAKSKTIKSARVVGDVIGKYHPHGDASTYSSLVSLVHRQYAIGQGNFGAITLKPTRAAAYRYTEVQLNPIMETIAFELIKFVPFGDPENLQVEQPLYLTSPIPIGLIGDGIISGISFNTTKMPRYTLPDLIMRLENIKQRQFDPSIPPISIVPNLPNFAISEANPGDFENILTNGEGSIIIQPHMTADSYGVHVWGKPPAGVSTWLNETEQKPNIYNCDDVSSNGLFEALFSPKPGIAYDQNFVNHIAQVVKTKVHFICNVVCDDKSVHKRSIDQMLINSYDTWVKHLTERYNAERYSLEEKIWGLKVIAIVRDIVNNNGIKLNRIDDIIAIFTQHYQSKYPTVSVTDIQSVCTKNNIRTLIEVSLDTKGTEDKLDAVKKIIADIDNVAYDKMKAYIA